MAVTFILVHGGFGSPAELAPTIPYLEAEGHRVINVDLPCENPDATLGDYADTVIRAMTGTTGRCILVAHSAGGATIPLVAARTPVDLMVFAAGIVPQPGESIYEAINPATQEAIMAVSVDNGDGTRSFNVDLLASFAPPDQRETYLAFLQATQRKQGMAAIYQPLPVTGIPDIPRSYILCTEDKLIDPERQRAFAAALGVIPIEIASEHSVFNAQPEALARILDSLSACLASSGRPVTQVQ
jgi:pimeloyl-ACP methyl ester carboxylesterase